MPCKNAPAAQFGRHPGGNRHGWESGRSRDRYFWGRPICSSYIIGNAAGVLIFGIFLFLLLSHRSSQRLRASLLSLFAAALALIWNAASLAVIEIGASHHFTATAVASAGFCALSLLPSVLLDLCLGTRLRTIVRLGYALSSIAALSHIVELFRNAADFHRLGLAIITIGFGLLSAVAVFASRRCFRGNYPDRFEFGQKRQHIVRIEKVIIDRAGFVGSQRKNVITTNSPFGEVAPDFLFWPPRK
jgi:hypothetical protein